MPYLRLIVFICVGILLPIAAIGATAKVTIRYSDGEEKRFFHPSTKQGIVPIKLSSTMHTCFGEFIKAGEGANAIESFRVNCFPSKHEDVLPIWMDVLCEKGSSMLSLAAFQRYPKSKAENFNEIPRVSLFVTCE